MGGFARAVPSAVYTFMAKMQQCSHDFRELGAEFARRTSMGTLLCFVVRRV